MLILSKFGGMIDGMKVTQYVIINWGHKETELRFYISDGMITEELVKFMLKQNEEFCDKDDFIQFVKPPIHVNLDVVVDDDVTNKS